MNCDTGSNYYDLLVKTLTKTQIVVPIAFADDVGGPPFMDGILPEVETSATWWASDFYNKLGLRIERLKMIMDSTIPRPVTVDSFVEEKGNDKFDKESEDFVRTAERYLLAESLNLAFIICEKVILEYLSTCTPSMIVCHSMSSIALSRVFMTDRATLTDDHRGVLSELERRFTGNTVILSSGISNHGENTFDELLGMGFNICGVKGDGHFRLKGVVKNGIFKEPEIGTTNISFDPMNLTSFDPSTRFNTFPNRGNCIIFSDPYPYPNQKRTRVAPHSFTPNVIASEYENRPHLYELD